MYCDASLRFNRMTSLHIRNPILFSIQFNRFIFSCQKTFTFKQESSLVGCILPACQPFVGVPSLWGAVVKGAVFRGTAYLGVPSLREVLSLRGAILWMGRLHRKWHHNTSFPRGQNDWHTPVKTLPCRIYCWRRQLWRKDLQEQKPEGGPGAIDKISTDIRSSTRNSFLWVRACLCDIIKLQSNSQWIYIATFLYGKFRQNFSSKFLLH